MASWQVRRRHGDMEGTMEPSDARVLMLRVFGGFFVLVGVGIFLDVLP
jgi:hypothetical protein